jgi:hypothetical protein
MMRHVGAETLARHREGILGGRKSARIRAHLARCSRCAALQADLAGVSALLANAPQPAMPEQVTARIQAALLAEAARTAPLGAAREAGQSREPGRLGELGESREAGQSREPGQPGEPRLPRVPGQPRELAKPGHSRHATGRGGSGRWGLPELRSPLAVRALAAAAAVVVIAGGVYGAIQLAGGQSGINGAASSAAAPAHAAIPGVGPPLRYTSAGRPADITPVSTSMNFTSRQLTSQVRSALNSGRSLHNLAPEASVQRSASAAPLTAAGGQGGVRSFFGGVSVTALQGCVQRISAGRQVLLVDVGRYQGRPATVIVVKAGHGSRILVVGPQCSRSGSDVIARASLPGAG